MLKRERFLLELKIIAEYKVERKKNSEKIIFYPFYVSRIIKDCKEGTAI
ncbi:hypothetical protein AAJ76_640007632 [Vairimorpha ceranae]|uniref:Uncharacterized protein n=1 Tax=Vairimorpha ceranae TaxID=40302 RepID=A0A0F9WNC0_9MICR|nr:hypothetical protein AAJ76_640007632 [Vairimorpha ceranae]KKO74508.1 hypothetical protein AAJ76_640007632 [Vairimorpha ceranae]